MVLLLLKLLQPLPQGAFKQPRRIQALGRLGTPVSWNGRVRIHPWLSWVDYAAIRRRSVCMSYHQDLLE